MGAAAAATTAAAVSRRCGHNRMIVSIIIDHAIGVATYAALCVCTSSFKI